MPTFMGKIISPQSAARISAALGHNPDDVIAGLQKDFGLSYQEAVKLVTKEYVLRQQLDEEDERADSQ